MNVLEPVAAIAAVNATGIGVRVEFSRHGDRYTHRLLAQNDSGAASVLLTALEDRLHADWPCSPIGQALNLDELRRHTPADAPAAMLIGMAGDGHWSMTVESDRAGCGLIFDVACRVKSLPPRLTSTYLLGEDSKCSKNSAELLFENHLGSFALRPLPIGQESHRSCQIETSNSELCLAAEVDWESNIPSTMQWRYGLWLIS